MTRGGKYYPDFIAIDTAGLYWLMEGKSDHDVLRSDVEAKRPAAEEWARFVNDDGRFGTWHYLFCSETAIKNSHNAWRRFLYRLSPDLSNPRLNHWLSLVVSRCPWQRYGRTVRLGPRRTRGPDLVRIRIEFSLCPQDVRIRVRKVIMRDPHDDLKVVFGVVDMRY